MDAGTIIGNSKKAVFVGNDTLMNPKAMRNGVGGVHVDEQVVEGLRLLNQSGFGIYWVTNQAGVSHGLFCEDEVKETIAQAKEALSANGVDLAGVYYCPHFPDGKLAAYKVNCFCRKPAPGMLFQAAREHDLNLAASWVVGSLPDDIEAGRRADCNTILISDRHRPADFNMMPLKRPNHVTPNYLEAAKIIQCGPGNMQTGIFLPVSRPSRAAGKGMYGR